MSNRLLALVSTTVLAVITDRVFEFIWLPDQGCAANFTDLFSFTSRLVSPSLPISPIIADDFISAKDLPNSEHQNMSGCHIDLRQQGKADFMFLFDPIVFRHIDEHCHVIMLRGNQYFAPVLLNMGSLIEKLELTEPYFRVISSRIKLFRMKYPTTFRDIMRAFYWYIFFYVIISSPDLFKLSNIPGRRRQSSKPKMIFKRNIFSERNIFQFMLVDFMMTGIAQLGY
jgi:hypothetical protein